MPRQLGSVATAGAGLPADADPLPDQDAVAEWLGRLCLLYGVPFNYLVPDETMLPTESIRFFQLDASWLVALLDGAFSLGFAGVTQTTTEAGRAAVMESAQAEPPVSGFLLRSFVVAGWPGLGVAGFSDAAGQQPIGLLRSEQVGPSVLLGLFSGALARVDLTEPTHSLSSGFDGTGPNWTKGLRYATASGGHAVGDPIGGTPLAVPLRSGRVVDMAGLARGMAQTVSPCTPADFGFELAEGAATVSFIVEAGG